MISDELKSFAMSFIEDCEFISSSFSFEQGDEIVTLKIDKKMTRDKNKCYQNLQKLGFIDDNIKILTYLRNKITEGLNNG